MIATKLDFIYNYHMGYRIEILKPGSHVSMSGVRVSINRKDIADLAAGYSVDAFQAPVVVGHPDTNSPAYAWVKGLADDGGVLMAELDQIDDDFKTMVNAGRFKNVSASLYAPQSPGNPKPGAWYLRHVGFLGAAPPAVKGLKPVSFAGDESLVFDFSMENKHINNSEGDKDMNKEELEAREKALAEKEKAIAAKVAEFAESEKAAEVDKLKAMEAELATREKALQAKADEMARAEYASFAEGLIKTGRIVPAEKDYVISVLAKASKDSVINFSEKEMTEADAFKAFLEARPAKVDMSEHSAGDKSKDAPGKNEYDQVGERIASHMKKGGK